MKIFDIDNPIGHVIKCEIPLAFSAEDKATYPWLDEQEDRFYLLGGYIGQGAYPAFSGRRLCKCSHRFSPSRLRKKPLIADTLKQELPSLYYARRRQAAKRDI
jgi:hypothetical protein